MDSNTRKAYWRQSLKYIFILISLWAVVGLILPIVLFEPLNTFSVGNVPAGFWFSVQGSQISLVALLFIYAYLMNRLDKKFGMDEE